MYALLHRALRGLFDFNALPKPLQGILKEMQAKRARQGNRSVRRYMQARKYYFTALAGGGAREVARRRSQIEAGRLRAENGVVF
jgi:hypothetical protein